MFNSSVEYGVNVRGCLWDNWEEIYGRFMNEYRLKDKGNLSFIWEIIVGGWGWNTWLVLH